MQLADDHSIAKPGLCPSFIAPFTIAISLHNTKLTVINCHLTRIANPATYPSLLSSRLPALSLTIY